jgi:hypothetical protein
VPAFRWALWLIETQKWTFSPPFQILIFGRSFIVANDQFATSKIH